MSLMQTVFGGSKGGGSFVDQTQQPFLKDVYTQAQNTYGDTSGQDYGQQFQQPSFNGFNQLMQGGYQDPSLQQGLQNFGQNQDQYLQGNIDAGLNDITRNFQQNLLPSISAGSAMTGTSGGSRQGVAEGLALNEASRTGADFVNRMRSGNFQNTQDNQLNAFNQMGGLQNQQNTAVTQGLNLAPNLSGMGMDNQWGNLNQYGQLVGSANNLSKGTTSNNGMFTGENAGMAGMMTMLSDRRLKDNIVRIGTTDGGTPLYRFNYKWSPDMVIGVMADEVDDAITVDVGGYKAVDYSRVK